MSRWKKKQGDATKKRILANALLYSEEFGYSNVTADNIAERSEVVPSNIKYHFGKIQEFHNTIISEAIKKNNYIVIAQGIAAGNPIALSASKQLKDKALGKVEQCHYMKQQES